MNIHDTSVCGLPDPRTGKPICPGCRLDEAAEALARERQARRNGAPSVSPAEAAQREREEWHAFQREAWRNEWQRRGWLDEDGSPIIKGDAREGPRRRDADADPFANLTTATYADVSEQMGSVAWTWENWIPSGMLTAIASNEGVGKTRLVGDLVRRIQNGEPWPDGAPMTLNKESTVLWVPSDSQYRELVRLFADFSIDAARVFLNAAPDAIQGGTLLDELNDVLFLQQRIRTMKPALVVIDTVSGATFRNMTKPEEVKRFCVPLQNVANETDVPVLLLAHLSREGAILGRRLAGQCRSVIKLEQSEDNENLRKLQVAKSFFEKPAPLALFMGSEGNQYEQWADDAHGHKQERTIPPKLKEAMDWLREELVNGARKLHVLRDDAEAVGFSPKTLYKARDELGLLEDEVTERGKPYKTWELHPDDYPEE